MKKSQLRKIVRESIKCCDELSPCPDDRIEKPIKRDKQLRR